MQSILYSCLAIIIPEHQLKNTNRYIEKKHYCQYLALSINRFDRLSLAGTSLTHYNLCFVPRASEEEIDGPFCLRNPSVGSVGFYTIASLPVKEASITL